MRLTCAFLVLFILTGGSAFSQEDDEYQDSVPTTDAGRYYSNDDFYFLDKTGKRVQLNIDKSKVVVQFLKYTEISLIERVLAESGIPPQNRRKITVNFGAAELRRTVYSSDEVFIIDVPPSVNNLDLINLLLGRTEVYDASPVFRMNSELVYPAGLWVYNKYASGIEMENLRGKILRQGYSPFWNNYGYRRPDGVSPRLSYFKRSEQHLSNPLRLSRLIAQDVLAVWSIPDFVPLVQPVEITAELSRPSGTMNGRFVATYRVKYDQKKIIPDAAALSAIETMTLKPRILPEGLFRSEAIKVENVSAGNIVVRFAFRIYEPGTYELIPLDMRYNFIGAPQGAAPESALAPVLSVKISGLVPRDLQGTPLAGDIFGMKKMELINPEIPDMPKAVDYPPTDIRFYAKSMHSKYPMTGLYLMFSAYIIFAILVLYLCCIYCASLFRRIRVKKNTKAAEFAALSDSYIRNLHKGKVEKTETEAVLRSARRCVREILAAPEGMTAREMFEECSGARRENLSELLEFLDTCSAADNLKAEDIANIRLLIKKLRGGVKWRR